MRQAAIETITRLNDEYISKYLGSQDKETTVVDRSSPIPHLDTNNKLPYPIEYFDLMTVTLLVNNLPNVKSHISANLASLIIRLAKDGLIQGKILPEQYADELVTSIMYNKLPNPNHIYQYLSFIERYDSKVLPNWFYYTLLLWVYNNTTVEVDDDSVSKLYVWMVHNINMVKFKSHATDRNHDVMDAGDKFRRIIKMWIRSSEEMDTTESIYYILDMLRTTSTILLSALISRSCHWATLQEIGSEMLGYQLSKHQTSINNNFIQKR